MRGRSFAWLVFALVFASAGRAAPGAPAVAQASHVCGPSVASHALERPPDVEMWNAPLDASDEHELILAVHRDGDRFCYRYAWGGVVRTVAPTIRVRRGEHFALRIANDISGPSRGENVASTAMLPCMPMHMPPATLTRYVGYLNHTVYDRYMHVAPVDTNIHLHGFQGPADQENIFLSTLSTPLHACEYRITIPRTQPPGMYLYHPHVHGASYNEVAGGLAGVWIVEPDEPQLARSAEHVIILRYRLPARLDNPFAPDEGAFGTAGASYEGARPAAPPVSYDPFKPPPWPVTFPMRAGGVALDPTGCDGLASEAIVSVNGSETPARLGVPAARTQLLRILNATSDSPKLLRIRDGAGREVPFRVVGLDGVPVSGNMEHPLAGYIPMNSLMLSPMSRADVLVTLEPGSTLTLSSEHFCEGKDMFFQMHHDLLTIAGMATGSHAANVASGPVAIAATPAARLVAFVRTHPSLVHRRAITFTEYAFPRRGAIPLHAAYYITDTTNPHFHEHPFWPVYRPGAMVPSNPDIVVRQGAIEEWYLINATMESHAFHIHQMAFVQEHSPMGMPVTIDTVFVPVGSLQPNPQNPNYPLVNPSITRVILDFRHVPKGEFVFHCHMLFHEDRGMMGIIRVE